MTMSSIVPRPDQIGALTKGLRLPLRAMDAAHLEIISEGLCRAFCEIRAEHPAAVASGSEAEVTALLEARLNILVEEDELWRQLVLCAVRGKESLSFDGSHIEKRPDISIYLSSRERNFPLIVEAKVLDSSTSKTVTMYCDNGLCRFLRGDYAWANQEAFMLAYVRDGSSIAGSLTPFLKNDKAKASPRYAVQMLPTSTISCGSSDLSCSRHARTFEYINRAPPAQHPGPMTIWHLWLP